MCDGFGPTNQSSSAAKALFGNYGNGA